MLPTSVVFRLATYLCLASVLLLVATAEAQSQPASGRVLSGIVISEQSEVVPGATVVAQYASGKKETVTDAGGRFRMVLPIEPLTINVLGGYVVFEAQSLSLGDVTEGLQPASRVSTPRPATPSV